MDEVITSVKNPKIQLWKSLQERKSRLKNGLFIVEGKKMVDEALSSPFHVDSILIEDGYQGIEPEIRGNIPCFHLSKAAFESLCDTKTPQGIMAVVALPSAAAIKPGFRRIAALDDVQDPGNVGTIIRTADAAGFDGVLLSRSCADVFSPKVLRSTMGSIFHISISITDDLPFSLARLKSEGCSIISSQLDGEPFFERKPVSTPLCLVIGNEGNGIRQEIKQMATHRYKLPMEGKAESLNAAVAAGIMMYDLIRDNMQK